MDVPGNARTFFSPDYLAAMRAGFWREPRRPWKLVTFALSMSVLLYGAVMFEIADWDVGVTLLMGTLTYLLAPWCLFVVVSALQFRPAGWWWHLPVAIAVALFVVDTSYMVYSQLVGNQTDREGNFHASFPLYFLAGAAWLYRGSLRELLADLRSATRKEG
ncbi:hypothetical protein [Tahibacter amnicola]|uniref:Uncharacterized protein n=1 Tax=Tahibacter amnicola TaxID=2976241 RepID=A0ABY6BE09_9GAMM|nr:hypothetical protein [Tahibacter amnicola]UXI68084.1 hypothetical protein N4264_00065 [Tahibacter amnicola]